MLYSSCGVIEVTLIDSNQLESLTKVNSMYKLNFIGKKELWEGLPPPPKGMITKLQKMRFESYTIEIENVKIVNDWRGYLYQTRKIHFLVKTCHYYFLCDHWEVLTVEKKVRTTRKNEQKTKVIL